MKAGLRSAALRAARSAGLFSLWRFSSRRQVTILRAHGVMDSSVPSEWTPMRAQIPLERLDRALGILRRFYRFVSLDEAVKMIAGELPIRSNCIAFTFDDGYRNNFRHGWPILKRHGAPATFFVCTGPVEGGTPFWFDRLDYALQHAAVHGRSFSIGGIPCEIDASDRESLRASFEVVRRRLKAAARHDGEMRREVEDLASALEAEGGTALSDILDRDDWAAVGSWPDIRQAQREGATIGSHTVDHVRLGLVGPEQAREQLLGSKQEIERQTGQPCHHFCFPSGSYSEESTVITRECGYRSAVTTRDGRNKVGDDPMTLRRLTLPYEGTETEILAQACGLTDMLGRVRTSFSRGGTA